MRGWWWPPPQSKHCSCFQELWVKHGPRICKFCRPDVQLDVSPVTSGVCVLCETWCSHDNRDVQLNQTTNTTTPQAKIHISIIEEWNNQYGEVSITASVLGCAERVWDPENKITKQLNRYTFILYSFPFWLLFASDITNGITQKLLFEPYPQWKQLNRCFQRS